ncbi:hypothetical protein EZV62_003317 [Acer yangbiense]|uniref:Uncharacterized protein n=1 Tax=Acer yangbiense TaxID=1000413 RepID=A0A5C7II37_9ROSI|nr:hypothetical protein EZV62_003317 [Acer yangbiense]
MEQAKEDQQMINDLQKIFEEEQIKLMKNKIRERNVDVAPYLALYQAIRKKNWKDVEEFVTKHPDALHDDITATGENIFHFLTYCSQKETVEYLISETAKVEDLTQDSGMLLLKTLITYNLFGTALDLLEQYPELASIEVAPNEGSRYWKTNFDMMVTKPQIYATGSIPLQEEKNPLQRVGGDILEKQTDRFQCCLAKSKPLKFLQATFGL